MSSNPIWAPSEITDKTPVVFIRTADSNHIPQKIVGKTGQANIVRHEETPSQCRLSRLSRLLFYECIMVAAFTRDPSSNVVSTDGSRKSQRFRTKGRNKTAEKRRANAAAKKQEAELAAVAAAEAQAAAAAAEAAAAAAEVAAAAGEEPEESEEEQDPLDSDSERESDSDTSEEESDDDEDEYLPRGPPAKKAD
ncbi:hypothetical protein B0H13DRAFT_1864461 [Mycena leptocephala]|nr:hypothetical protein B0H13DRAFT_1864461 [Mycena leptocephala]